MNWIVASLIMYLCSVFYYISLRYFQKKNIDNTYLNWISFLIFTLIIGGYSIIFKISLEFPLYYLLLTIVVVFFFSYLGNTFSLEGTKFAPNPGYSLIIQKSYAIFTSIASIFLFSSEFNLKSLISILIVVAFLLVLVYQKKSRKINSFLWVYYSLAAFFAFGGLALYTKWLLNEGISIMSRTVYGALIVMIFFGIELIFRKKIKQHSFSYHFTKLEKLLLLLQGLSLGLFNLFMNEAYSSAPNVGYVNIVNGASITLITIIAAIIYKDKLNAQKIIGIIGVTAGLIILFV